MIPCNNLIAILRGIRATEANIDVMRRGLPLYKLCVLSVRGFSNNAAKAAKKKF